MHCSSTSRTNIKQRKGRHYQMRRNGFEFVGQKTCPCSGIHSTVVSLHAWLRTSSPWTVHLSSARSISMSVVTMLLSQSWTEKHPCRKVMTQLVNTFRQTKHYTDNITTDATTQTLSVKQTLSPMYPSQSLLLSKPNWKGEVVLWKIRSSFWRILWKISKKIYKKVFHHY